MSCIPFRLSILFIFLASASCGEESPGGTINPNPDTTSVVDPGNTTPDTNTNGGPDLTNQIDTPPIDTNIPPTTLQRACGVKNTGLGPKLIGAPCVAHEECSTGYCYDEWYLNWGGGFRFCTIACNGCDSTFNACDDYNDQSPGRPLKCHIVSNNCTKQIFPDMVVKGFCVPTCVSASQCIEAYGSGIYTSCDQAKMEECGTFGTPNNVCFVPEP